ncbi:MAG: CinA family nicotinamide mononucleotide deamidase-related protein [Phycisphaerales bacterium]|nr:CinA family nicotinamide mononucleotide deamidase-related protein [Phycisphaerales bacterium]
MEHRTAAIVSMGDELTLGQTLDTNSRWLSQRLVEAGIVPVEHVTAPDDLERIAAVLARLAQGVDLIISSGGLGPTADDLTREALARAMGDVLVEDAASVAQIGSWFRSRGREMPVLNRVQALRPARGEAIENRNGTAPGLYGRIGEVHRLEAGATGFCDVFCLPGPPREMQPMFESFVRGRLSPPAGRVVITRVLHTVGIGESDLAMRLGGLMARDRNPLVGTTASGGIVSIRIRYEGSEARNRAEAMVERAAQEAAALGAPHVFGGGTDSLASVVIDKLRRRGERLSVVESCTGGMLGSVITEVAGSSDVFWGGWITYANQTKREQVGVSARLFAETGPADAPGAVSREVAEAMARGGLERSGTDHCLSITGIAGPGGGTEAKPVGTVWIARAWRSAEGIQTEARRFAMGGDRAAVREWSARWALAMLWLGLEGRGEVKLLRQVE